MKFKIQNVKVITSREEDSVFKYFKDIYKISLLSSEEEKQLAIEIKKGNKEARNKLIEANLRFVISIAKQYQNKGANLADLINEGNLGLIHAAETFDESKGFKFISYAVYWIRQAILAALTEQAHLVHIPFNQYYLHTKVKNIIEDQNIQGNILSNEEIAGLINANEKEVSDVLKDSDVMEYAISLNSTFQDEDKLSLINVIKNENAKSPDSELIQESMKQDLEKVLKKILDEREYIVISMNYGLGDFEPMSFKEIGDRLNLTKECIRQIKEKAMRKLRMSSRVEKLKQYI